MNTHKPMTAVLAMLLLPACASSPPGRDLGQVVAGEMSVEAQPRPCLLRTFEISMPADEAMPPVLTYPDARRGTPTGKQQRSVRPGCPFSFTVTWQAHNPERNSHAMILFHGDTPLQGPRQRPVWSSRLQGGSNAFRARPGGHGACPARAPCKYTIFEVDADGATHRPPLDPTIIIDLR